MLLRFDEFQLDTQRHKLTRAGRMQKIERIPLELLSLLVERRGQLVSREAIVEQLWGRDVYLEADHSVNTAINKIRNVLREDLAEPRFIQTIKGKGYRFVADVDVLDDGTAEVETQKASSELPPQISGRAAQTSLEEFRQLDESAEIGDIGCDPSALEQELQMHTSSRNSNLTNSARAFRYLAVLVVVAVVTGIVFFGRAHSSAKGNGDSPADIRSLAVLPFVNLSQDAGREYFVDGMTDQLITDLAQITGMRVISRTSVMQYKGVRRPLPEIASALNVDAIVEGSVQYSDHRVRITAQLLDARRDRHLWARTYDRDQGELLALQTEVTRDISDEILKELNSKGNIPSKKHSPVPEAYDNYLLGRYFWNKRDLESLGKSVEYYRRAIEIDPRYALAYAGLAESYGAAAYADSWGRAKAVENAERAARKALELDETLAAPHATLASLLADMEFDPAAADQEFRNALALNPGYAVAHQGYSNFLSLTGRHDEAILEAQRALRLDPLSLIINSQLGWAFYYAGRYDEAIAQLKKTLDLDGSFAPARHRLAAAYELKGMHDAAIAELQKMGDRLQENGAYLALLGYAYAHAGYRDRASRVLRQIKALPSPQFGNVDLALIYLGIGDVDHAFFSLKRARAAREIVGVRADPLFAPLRADPRFGELFDVRHFNG